MNTRVNLIRLFNYIYNYRLLYYLPMERMTPDTIDFNSLSKKQLVELVIAKYNDCFRLEEENKKLKLELSKLKEKYGDLDY